MKRPVTPCRRRVERASAMTMRFDFDTAIATLVEAYGDPSDESMDTTFAEQATAALDDKEHGCDNVACIMNVLKTMPVMVDTTLMPLGTALERIVKKTNAEFERIQKINVNLISTAMEQTIKIKELENEIKTIAVEHRFVRSLSTNQGTVCSHCLVGPAQICAEGRFYCSSKCQEACPHQESSTC